MKTVTIETQDTNAFDTFVLTKQELELLDSHKMKTSEVDALVMRVLDSLDVAQLVKLKQEATESDLTLTRCLRSVIMLAVGDYLGQQA